MDKKYHEKLSLIKQLFTLANVGHEVKTIEIEFIKEVAKWLGVKEKDLYLVEKRAVEMIYPVSEFERIYFFHSFVLLMGIDRNYTKEEFEYCRYVGVKLGLNSFSVEALLNLMKNNKGKPVPSEEIIKIFKVNYN